MRFNTIVSYVSRFLSARMASSASTEKMLAKERLSALTPALSTMCSISAIPALSMGVLHHGEIIHTAHFGQRDLDHPGPPDDDTVYYIASLTKAITAAAIGMLVEDGKLTWQTKIRDVLHDYSRDDEAGQATITDFLCHRTGLAGANALWVQRNQDFYMAKRNTVKTTNYIKAVAPFRKTFTYNNWGYGIATQLIESLEGKSYGTFVKEKIFDPLGLSRSTLDIPAGDNVAHACAIRDDGSAVRIPQPPQSDETGLAGAGGAKSSVRDLLTLYGSLMSAAKDQKASKTNSTSGSPFKQMNTIFEPHNPIGSDGLEEEAYTLGWVRAKLPRRLGRIGMNELYLGEFDKLPIIGQSSPGTVVYHHQGNLVGMLSSVHLIPETETAIIVMCNALSFTDVADLIGELALESVLGANATDKFLSLSEEIKTGFHAMYPGLQKELQDGKTDAKPSKPLKAYTGKYYNEAGTFVLEVTEADNGLTMVSQGFKDAAYSLVSYDGDTFYWPADREDEMCTHSMFPWIWTGVHKVSFSSSGEDGDAMDRLAWEHDWEGGPETFFKSNDGAPLTVQGSSGSVQSPPSLLAKMS